MNRILLETSEVDAQGVVTLTGRRAQHVLRILHPDVGQALKVGLLNGPTGTGKVLKCAADSVTLACTFSEASPPHVPALSLLLALPRPKVLKRLWAPLASLSVAHLVLTNAAKVERNYFDTHWLEEVHYRPRLIEGLEQAGHTRLPTVTICRQFKPFVEDELDRRFPSAARLLAHPAAARRVREVPLPGASGALIAIGPEGGWIPYELALLEHHGFTAVSTSTEPLRSDVACIALVAIVREQLA